MGGGRGFAKVKGGSSRLDLLFFLLQNVFHNLNCIYIYFFLCSQLNLCYSEYMIFIFYLFRLFLTHRHM